MNGKLSRISNETTLDQQMSPSQKVSFRNRLTDCYMKNKIIKAPLPTFRKRDF